MKFILKLLLLLSLQLFLNEAPPVKKDGPSDAKKASRCFFSFERTSTLEELKRPKRSQVSVDCEGGYTDLSTLSGNSADYGAPHELALVLARGMGLFMDAGDDPTIWKGEVICDRHLNELSRQYELAKFKHIIKSNAGIARCGFPQLNHHRNAERTLTFAQSFALLRLRKYLLHVGTPLCKDHHAIVRDLTTAVDEDATTESAGAPEADDAEEGKCAMEVEDEEFKLRNREPKCVDPIRKLFNAFAKEAGASRVIPRKKYSDLKEREKRYRLHAATILGNVIIEMLAETEEDQESLRAAIKASIYGRLPTVEDSKMISELLTTAAKNYREAKNAQERVQILSLYARDVPYRMMVNYIDGLSERLWNQAKKMAIDKKSYIPPDHRKERYDPVKLNYFVSFITSPHIMVGLPWGVKKTKDSQGNVVELPNMIRKTGVYETIRLYESYMDESGRSSLKFSNSTTYRILTRLPSMKSHAISCIDYYEAASTNLSFKIINGLLNYSELTFDYFQAILDIEKMLDELETMSLLDRGEVNGYKASFQQIKDYLRGNYKLHAKLQSYYSDHCLTWALSDPKNSYLVAPHSHAHQKRCPHCKGADEIIEKLKESLIEFKGAAKGANVKKLDEFIVEYDFNVEKLYELKAHHARSVFTSLERERIIASLDSTAVVEVIRHLLKQLKIMGIAAVHLRSDNAATTDVEILDWSFSESQSGKSSSDRVAALVKRKMRSYISKIHDVDTVDRMLEAIDAEKQLNGVSAYVGTVKLEESSPTKIAKISEYGHFAFLPPFNTAWRFHRIGQGIKLPDLTPINATFTISKSGGKLASATVNTTDRANLEAGTPTEFWFLPPVHHPRHPYRHEPNDEDDEEATGRPQLHNPAAAHHESLYYCRDCGASFIRYSNLIHHIESGRHKIRPDRISLFDKTLGLFKRALEDVQQDLTLTPFNEAIRKIRSGNEPSLPMGWAIRAGKKGGRLPEKAKAFITKLWNDRRKVHLKLREEEAWNNMKAEPSIAPHERMTRDQIKNLIKTLVQNAKPKKTKTSTKTKTRGPRKLPDEEMEVDEEEDEDEGVFYEEVDVAEEDIVITDDDIHKNILDELDFHFDDIYNPNFADHAIGILDFE